MRTARVLPPGNHRQEVAGHGWEPRAVGGEITQRDECAASLRHPDMLRKISCGRIVQSDLFALHHVRQQQRREDLRDRPDLEDRVSIDHAWIALGEVAMSDDAATTRFDETHDNAGRLLLL